MSMRIAIAVLVGALGVVASAQQAKSVKPKHALTRHAHNVHHAKHVAPAKGAEPFVNQGPMPPAIEETVAEPIAPSTEQAATPMLTPDSTPAPTPPPPVTVRYEHGALAIRADDAELREVLDAIREETGALVEAPTLIVGQRVTVQIEPRAPVQAMAALLDGMHLDYAMLGGANTNDPLRRIILMPRVRAARTPGSPGPSLSESESQPPRTAALRQLEQTGGDEGVLESAPASNGSGRSRRDH